MRTIMLTGTTVFNASTSDIAIPCSPAFRTNTMAKARGDICVIGLNGMLQVALGIQTSDDGQTWSDHTGTLIIGYSNTVGWIHATTYADLSTYTAASQYYRFVYYVKLSSGTVLSTAYVYGSVDPVAMT